MSKVKTEKPTIAALDIGSTKVVIVIGTPTPEGKIDIAGVGSAPNTGIRQGVVVNIDATTDAILKAKEEAELMSGYKIDEVWIGVSGSHIKSLDSKGMVAIKNKEVTPLDVERVLEAAKAVAVPGDRALLHVLPREFKVDETEGIWDPVGMSGVRLEAAVHLVTGSHTSLQNALKCAARANLKVAGLVLDQLAAAMAILSDDEKNLGVCLVDIGGGTTNLLYFKNGHVSHTSVIPLGGQHFTQDIAIGLRTPQIAAEDLKKKHGCALSTLVSETETVEVEGVGGRKSRSVLRRDLAEVVEPRAEELLQMVYADILQNKMNHQLGAGVVLTGGSSQMEGMLEMAEFVLDLPVRRGMPNQLGGLTDVVKSPAYATAVGLIKYGYSQMVHKPEVATDDLKAGLVHAVQNVKDFFGKIF